MLESPLADSIHNYWTPQLLDLQDLQSRTDLQGRTGLASQEDVRHSSSAYLVVGCWQSKFLFDVDVGEVAALFYDHNTALKGRRDVGSTVVAGMNHKKQAV
jgi:hypothetical protein